MKIRTDFVTNSSSSSFVVSYLIVTKNGEKLSVTSLSGDYELGVTLPVLDLCAFKKAGTVKEITDLIRTSVVNDIEYSDDEIDPGDDEDMDFDEEADDDDWDDDAGLEYYYKEELLNNVESMLQCVENEARSIGDIGSISVISIQEATGEMMDPILSDLETDGIPFLDPDVQNHNLAAVKQKLRNSKWGRNMQERHIDAAAKMLVDETNPQIVACGTKNTYNVLTQKMETSEMFATEEYVM